LTALTLCRVEVLPIDHFQRTLQALAGGATLAPESGCVFQMNSTGSLVDLRSFCMRISFSAVALAGVLLLHAPTVSAQDVNDAQIASIVITANQVDIDAGKLATSRSTNDDIKAFARLMVTDHTAVNKSATDLAAKLKVTPQDNPTSQSLKVEGDKNLDHLKTLKGAAFDKAYVDREVAYHQQVIDALDKTLIPGATNAELKALLVKVRPAFVAHLEHAKRLQASAGGKH
jgi:putative membrane protein